MPARPFIDSLDFARNGQQITGEVLVNQLSRLADVFESKQDEYKTFENKYIQIQQFEQTYDSEKHQSLSALKNRLNEEIQHLSGVSQQILLLSEQKSQIEHKLLDLSKLTSSAILSDLQNEALLCQAKLDENLAVGNNLDSLLNQLSFKKHSLNSMLSELIKISESNPTLPITISKTALITELSLTNDKIFNYNRKNEYMSELSFIDASISNLLVAVAESEKKLVPVDTKNISPDNIQPLNSLLTDLQESKNIISSHIKTLVSNKALIEENINLLTLELTTSRIENLSDYESALTELNKVYHNSLLKEQELEKLSKISKNITFGETKSFCSCCNQELNFEQISEHITALEKHLREYPSSLYYSQIKKLSTSFDKAKIFTNNIAEISPQINDDMLFNLVLEFDFIQSQIALIQKQILLVQEYEKAKQNNNIITQ